MVEMPDKEKGRCSPLKMRTAKSTANKLNVSARVILLTLDNDITMRQTVFDRSIKGKKTLLQRNYLKKCEQANAKTRRSLPKACATVPLKAIIRLTAYDDGRTQIGNNGKYRIYLSTRKNWFGKYQAKPKEINKQLNLKNKLLEAARKRAAIRETIKKTSRGKYKENAFFAKIPISNYTQYLCSYTP
eukprot:TRINITY_DN10556_c0_g10_i1.p1 TRINITY_DN10556_c0_g10~~TRINITY_DN10556_c0_g10_i1.p1  ORF type:complete len:187 (+),score=17.10 TRINITY_DN10556_c0_g10_i1:192-752(+)